MEDIGVNYLADLFDLSPNYLSRIYHQQSGEKLIDFITKIRIENAKKLLCKNTTLTIRKISQRVGYYSPLSPDLLDRRLNMESNQTYRPYYYNVL